MKLPSDIAPAPTVGEDRHTPRPRGLDDANLLTARDVLNETISYFAKDPVRRRSLVPLKLWMHMRAENATYGRPRCYYHMCDGDNEERMCAVGRYLHAPDVNHVLDGRELQHIVEGGYLHPAVRHLPTSFWRELQHIHDVDDFWTETGLSAMGADRVAALRTHPICR